jgi:hypothetical protein
MQENNNPTEQPKNSWLSNICQVCGEEVKSPYINLTTNKTGHKRCV